MPTVRRDAASRASSTRSVQPEREHRGVALEIPVGREDCDAMPDAGSTDQEVGVGALNAPRATLVEALRGDDEIILGERQVAERVEVIAESSDNRPTIG